MGSFGLTEYSEAAPENPAWASSFADWVYRETYPTALPPDGAAKKTRLWLGELGHRRVLEAICANHETRKWFLPRDLLADKWRPVYADTGLEVRGLRASSLVVAGKPLRCRPDIIFRHMGTGAYAIVEIKMSAVSTQSRKRRDGSTKSFDPNGYPNNRAQLWAYSKIDNFENAEDLLLVLQFWDPDSLVLKHTRIWRAGDPMIDVSSEHFRRYCAFVQSRQTRTAARS